MEYTLTALSELKAWDADTSLYLCTFDNGVKEAYANMLRSTALEFLDQRVIVDFRKDMYEGNIVDFVNTLTRVSQVNVLERVHNLRLYSEPTDNMCNIDFRDIENGTLINNAVVYCTQHVYEDSAKASWARLTVLDRGRRVSSIRLFTPDSRKENFAGRYIKCDLKKTAYGLQTQDIIVLDGVYPTNPDIDIAKEFIVSTLRDDTKLCAYMDSIQLINSLSNYVSLEKGFELVRLAMELDLAVEMTNLSPSINIELIKRAIVVSYSHLTKANLALTPLVKNTILLAYSEFNSDVQLFQMLDDNEEESAERLMLKRIKETVSTLIDTTKGVSK